MVVSAVSAVASSMAVSFVIAAIIRLSDCFILLLDGLIDGFQYKIKFVNKLFSCSHVKDAQRAAEGITHPLTS